MAGGVPRWPPPFPGPCLIPGTVDMMVWVISSGTLDFKKGRLCGRAWPHHMSPLNLGTKVREKRRFEAWEGCSTSEILHCWLWRWRGARSKECGWPLKAENGSWLPASKGSGTSVLQPQELNSANNLNGLGRGPQDPSENTASQHLDFSFVMPWAEMLLTQRSVS